MKTNQILKCLVPAVLLAMAVPALQAADAPKNDKTPAERREQLKKQREEFKNLSPEEKAAKLKERKAKLEARVAALKKKKADGTITAQEERQLNRAEAMLKNADLAAPRAPRARKPQGDKPAGEAKPQ